MTLLYVLLVYLLALGRSRRRIRRMQIHDFMELDRQNENVVIRTSRRRRRVFVLSLLLGAVGTVLLLAGGCCLAWWGRGVSSPFSMAFFSALPRGARVFEKHPGRKYRGQTLVIFRTLTAKLATMGGGDGHHLPALYRYPPFRRERHGLQRPVPESDGKGLCL